MGKLSRRQLLKSGAGGALAVGALAAGTSPAHASGEDGIAVHIHGVVSLVANPNVKLAISIDASGMEDNLAGAGWDVVGPTGLVPTSVVGACYYTVAGQLDEDEEVVTLKGRSLFTNRPLATGEEDPPRSDTRADGRLVEVTANLATGEIHWSLGGNAFTGTGVVTKTD